MNKKVLIISIIGAVILIGAIGCCAVLYVMGRQASRGAQALEDEFGTLLDVCGGGAVAEAAAYSPGSGVHPAMGVSPGYSEGSFSFERTLVPRDAWPETLAGTELVFCVQDQEKVLVETCEYFDVDDEDEETSATIERYVYEREVVLIEAKTGAVVAEEVLRGTEPDECPDEAKFSEEGEVKTESGGFVSDDDVQEWVEAYVIVP